MTDQDPGPRLRSDVARPTADAKGRAAKLIVVVTILAVAGTLIGLIAVGQGDEDRLSDDSPTAAGRDPSDSTSSTPPTREETTTTSLGPGRSPQSPLALGASARVEDFEVTVTSVQFDAGAIVQEENPFNPPPAEGAYAIVELFVTYVGEDEGIPGFDISAVLRGGDGREYQDHTCHAVMARDRNGVPNLTNGESTSIRFCWDYAPASLPGSTLTVEPSAHGYGEEFYWTTGQPG